jgi:Uma2 family endonuclease
MVKNKEITVLPRTLEEFQDWEPNDGFKYEWNDGELIKFTGMNKRQLYIFHILNKLFIQKGYWELGTLVAEQDVELSGIQMRRPDIAFFTNEQIERAKLGNDEIPEFAIEIISGNDNINKVETKISEYYKAGVKVIWLIFPEEKTVHIYTSRRNVKICIENDICSANPVLPEFEIGVDVLLG